MIEDAEWGTADICAVGRRFLSHVAVLPRPQKCLKLAEGIEGIFSPFPPLLITAPLHQRHCVH